MTARRESAEQADIMLGVGARPDVRMFRNNTGRAWQGVRDDRSTREVLILQRPRIVHFGLCVGSSDLIGWQRVRITPEMVGSTIARFVAWEAKARDGVTTDEQDRFMAAVLAAGGAAGVARTVADAEKILQTPLVA